MGKPIRELLRRTLFHKKGNLINLDAPYPVMVKLLHGRNVHGILDAGASDGRISKRLLRLFPTATAYLFEPNPAYQSRLEALAQRDQRFKPFPFALLDREGDLTYYETESLGDCSLLKPSEQQPKRVSTVPAVTLDAWSQEQGNPPIEILKFDIQGAELSALRGGPQMLDRSVLLVYCEIWFNRVRGYEGGCLFGDVDLFLRDHGFELYNIYAPKSDDNDMLLWGNAIYYHRERIGH